MTNNQSEGLNRVIKDLQGWKEAPVDCVILAVYQLQAFYLNEIRRGFAGIGEYHLRLDYANIQANHGLVDYIPTSTPEEVVEKIRETPHGLKRYRSRKNCPMIHHASKLLQFKHEHNSCYPPIRSALIQS